MPQYPNSYDLQPEQTVTIIAVTSHGKKNSTQSNMRSVHSPGAGRAETQFDFVTHICYTTA